MGDDLRSLVAAAREGNTEAATRLSDLLGRYLHAVLRNLARKFLNPVPDDEARSIINMAVGVFVAQCDLQRSDSEMRAYATRIFSRMWLKEQWKQQVPRWKTTRIRKEEMDLSSQVSAEKRGDASPSSFSATDTGQSSEAGIVIDPTDRLFLGEVVKELKKLSSGQQYALQLNILDMCYEEIEKVIKRSARDTKHRGRKKLRERLKI